MKGLFPENKKVKMTDEEKVLEVVNQSVYALSYEEILVGVSETLYIARQRLKKALEELIRKGKIKRKAYKGLFSRKPKIYSVISEIYFTKEDQRIKYEKDILPKMERDTRHILRRGYTQT